MSMKSNLLIKSQRSDHGEVSGGCGYQRSGFKGKRYRGSLHDLQLEKLVAHLLSSVEVDKPILFCRFIPSAAHDVNVI